MSNYLKNETSFYLKEYINNSIHWYPWGDEALRHAQRDQKPIFLSIGYSGSYWCDVMREESFQDETIADLINEHCIAIKVDKDERTDVDKYFKQVYRLMNGQDCASPVSVFLTENLEPFYSAAYIASQPRGNVLGFEELLRTVHHKYHDDTSTMRKKGQEVLSYLNPKKRTIEATRLSMDVTQTIIHHANSLYDAEYGGFGHEPKFLNISTLDLLLDTYELTHERSLLTIVQQTLDTLAQSDMQDTLEGGFYRYANHKDWTSPRQEKMSYDNALLAALYWRMYGLTQKETYKFIAIRTLDFLLTSLRGDQLFYSHSVIKRDGSHLTDTKVTTSFNAIVIRTLLSVDTGEGRYRKIALETLDHLIAEHYASEQLLHTNGVEGFLEDYAFLGHALLEAYRTTEQSRYLVQAEHLAHQMIERFYDYGFWKFSNGTLSVYDDIFDPLYPSAMATGILFLHQLSFFVESDYNQFVFKTLEINSYGLMRQPLSSPTMSKVMLRYLKKML